MPSRRLPPEISKGFPSREANPPRSRLAASGCLLLALAVTAVTAVAGCSSGGAVRPEPERGAGPRVGIPAAERPFLVDPLDGYPLTPEPELAERVSDAFEALVRSGDPGHAEVSAEAVLASDPAFHPARVLAAQARYLAGDARGALDAVRAVTRELPGYLAAQLLAGRSAEATDDIPEAYQAYRAAAERSPAAAERAEALAERAVEVVANRFTAALAAGRTDAAAGHLRRLEAWAPDAAPTLQASLDLAAARGDAEAELAAVARLLERDPARRDLRMRQADLELASGDPSAGLQIYQRLAAENPGDAELATRLEQAKYRWRLTLLPAGIQEIAAKPELTRADFAALVYWLVPRVRAQRRAGEQRGGRIAGDILDHPRREEITRILGLGLMDVDRTLHTFSPGRAVRRAEALEVLLGAVTVLGGRPACLADERLGSSPGQERVCATAARCAVLGTQGDCRPGATLSGAEALELVRRASLLLG